MTHFVRSTFAMSGLLSVLGDAGAARACSVEWVPPLRIEFDAAEPDLEPEVRQALGAIFEAVDEGATDAAHVMTARLFERPLSDLAAAHAYRAAGAVFAEQGAFEPSVTAFEHALRLGALAEGDAQDVRYNLAKLDQYLERPERALDWFQSWFERLERPDSGDYRTILYALQRAGLVEDALRWSAIALERLPGEELDWHFERSSMQVELGRFDEIEHEVSLLAATSPEQAARVVRMSSSFFREDGEARAAGLLEWAWLHGLLDAEHQVELAKSYLASGDSYAAARLLERGLYDRVIDAEPSHWLLLAESWLAVHDVARALEPLRNAADQSGDPELYERLARLYFELRDWSGAEDALRAAPAEGSAERRLLLFAALFLQTRFDEARALLTSPPSPKATSVSEDAATPGTPCLGLGLAEGEGPVPGAWVGWIQSDSPASATELRTGDVIVQYDSRQLSDSEALLAETRAARPGEGFSLVVMRDARYLAVRGSVGERREGEKLCRGRRADEEASPKAQGAVQLPETTNAPSVSARVPDSAPLARSITMLQPRPF
jgi:tetratricopeptide (TPR) repeat protein